MRLHWTVIDFHWFYEQIIAKIHWISCQIHQDFLKTPQLWEVTPKWSHSMAYLLPRVYKAWRRTSKGGSPWTGPTSRADAGQRQGWLFLWRGRFGQNCQNTMSFQTQLVGRFRVASRGSRGFRCPPIAISRAVHNDSMSQSLQTRWHHGAALSQR